MRLEFQALLSLMVICLLSAGCERSVIYTEEQQIVTYSTSAASDTDSFVVIYGDGWGRYSFNYHVERYAFRNIPAVIAEKFPNATITKIVQTGNYQHTVYFMEAP